MKAPHIGKPHRAIKDNTRVQIIDTWNVPYSTGVYVLSQDDVPKEEVEKFAADNTHFPFWPLIYQGKLWSKDTWDD